MESKDGNKVDEFQDLKKMILSPIPISLILIGLAITIFSIDTLYESSIIEDYLLWLTPLFLAIAFILIVVSFIWSFKDIAKLFSKIDKRVWLIIIIIFIAGLYLRTGVAQQSHRLYFDEDIYLSIGQGIAKQGTVLFPTYGTPDNYIDGIYNKQPNGYPFLMSFLFLFGGNEAQAYTFTAVISSLAIILVFLIAYLLFDNEKIAMLAALFFTLIPIAIRWAPTTSADTAFIFFSGLAVFAFLIYIKLDNSKALLFAIATLAYAVQVRPESILLVIPIGLMFIFLKKNIFETMNKKHFILLIAVFSLLITPHLIHMNTVRDQQWGASGDQEKLGLENFGENVEVNSMFFFENTRYPIGFTMLSILGLALWKNWKKKIILGVWFLAFFSIYLFFYAGSFNYGVDVRFSLSFYIPLAILGGCGAYLISNVLLKLIKKEYITVGIASFIIILAFIPFIGFVGSYGEQAWDAKLAHDFLVEQIEEMDEDCWIFTQVPTVALVNGRNAANNGYAQDPEVIEKIFNETDEVYFYKEYWCDIEPYKSNTCGYFYDNFMLTVVDYTTQGNRNFTLFRIHLIE